MPSASCRSSASLRAMPDGNGDLMSVELHGYRYSVYLRIVAMTLLEKSVPWTHVEVDPFAETIPETYLSLNPFGRVPTLVHGGFALYETTAITRYVDEAFSGAPLQPGDAKARARMNQIIAVADFLRLLADGPAGLFASGIQAGARRRRRRGSDSRRLGQIEDRACCARQTGRRRSVPSWVIAFDRRPASWGDGRLLRGCGRGSHRSCPASETPGMVGRVFGASVAPRNRPRPAVILTTKYAWGTRLLLPDFLTGRCQEAPVMAV